MRPAGVNRKLSEYEIAEVKEVYRDVNAAKNILVFSNTAGTVGSGRG